MPPLDGSGPMLCAMCHRANGGASCWRLHHNLTKLEVGWKCLVKLVIVRLFVYCVCVCVCVCDVCVCMCGLCACVYVVYACVCVNVC